jgi:GGDEF domain-containing protein
MNAVEKASRGGEGFAIILSNANQIEAKAVAHTIRENYML